MCWALPDSTCCRIVRTRSGVTNTSNSRWHPSQRQNRLIVPKQAAVIVEVQSQIRSGHAVQQSIEHRGVRCVLDRRPCGAAPAFGLCLLAFGFGCMCAVRLAPAPARSWPVAIFVARCCCTTHPRRACLHKPPLPPHSAIPAPPSSKQTATSQGTSGATILRLRSLHRSATSPALCPRCCQHTVTASARTRPENPARALLLRDEPSPPLV